jgi:hypothetical protein
MSLLEHLQPWELGPLLEYMLQVRTRVIVEAHCYNSGN